LTTIVGHVAGGKVSVTVEVKMRSIWRRCRKWTPAISLKNTAISEIDEEEKTTY